MGVSSTGFHDCPRAIARTCFRVEAVVVLRSAQHHTHACAIGATFGETRSVDVLDETTTSSHALRSTDCPRRALHRERVWTPSSPNKRRETRLYAARQRAAVDKHGADGQTQAQHEAHDGGVFLCAKFERETEEGHGQCYRWQTCGARSSRTAVALLT